MKQKVVIIGGGIGGLGTACLLSKAGYAVTLLEKNHQLGGRAGMFEAQGFRFDTGPSWYLMPEAFEHFFDLLGETIHDRLTLQRLSPSYRVFFKDADAPLDIHGNLARDAATFESLEPGAGRKLRQYVDKSADMYGVATQQILYQNYDSPLGLLRSVPVRRMHYLNLLSNLQSYAGEYFAHPKLRQIMQYPAMFLGSSPARTPALYSLLSYLDFRQGVFYPAGGMYRLIEALTAIAKEQGARLATETPVHRILIHADQACGVELADGTKHQADIVISNADLHHTEQSLLPPEARTYTKQYWRKRTLGPSALLLYLGVEGSLPSLSHHNLVFSTAWDQHFAEIFDRPRWPTDPSYYVCNPSKTDGTVAPAGTENLFVLVPLAPGLSYTPNELEEYADRILRDMERHLDTPALRKRLVYKRLFCVQDFAQAYNSYRGTALGLAHTLRQSAAFRPKNFSKKVANLYYAGAAVHPGIGLPSCLISAELIYKRLIGDTSSGPLPTPIGTGGRR